MTLTSLFFLLLLVLIIHVSSFSCAVDSLKLSISVETPESGLSGSASQSHSMIPALSGGRKKANSKSNLPSLPIVPYPSPTDYPSTGSIYYPRVCKHYLEIHHLHPSLYQVNKEYETNERRINIDKDWRINELNPTNSAASSSICTLSPQATCQFYRLRLQLYQLYNQHLMIIHCNKESDEISINWTPMTLKQDKKTKYSTLLLNNDKDNKENKQSWISLLLLYGFHIQSNHYSDLLYNPYYYNTNQLIYPKLLLQLQLTNYPRIGNCYSSNKILHCINHFSQFNHKNYDERIIIQMNQLQCSMMIHSYCTLLSLQEELIQQIKECSIVYEIDRIVFKSEQPRDEDKNYKHFVTLLSDIGWELVPNANNFLTFDFIGKRHKTNDRVYHYKRKTDKTDKFI